MESIPPPSDTYTGRNGFGRVTSSNIYDWVSKVDNERELRRDLLKKQDVNIDTRSFAQKKWDKKQKEIKGIKLQETDPDYLSDYSERQILKDRLIFS